MKKRISILLSCFLLLGLLLPMTAFAAEVGTDEEPWSSEFSRIMDTTDSLSMAEIKKLDDDSMDILRQYHLDVAVAVIPEERLQGSSMEEFAVGLYKSCDFGYGDSRDGFMFLYLGDTRVLTVVPMGGAADALPARYLEFLEERVPSLHENHGVFGVVYGCQKMIRDGLDTEAEKAAGETEPEKVPGSGDFARCGEGSDMPAWFPVNPEEAYVYFDAEAPRIVDYAQMISDETEKTIAARIAEISAETGKDIVIVTDVSDYGLGDDIYAADFYDFNGYGIGPEHEGIILFLNMDPENRGGWTAETGPETRKLATESAANRLDDFLFAALAAGDYDRAFSEWVEDVCSLFTTGIVRPPFWYRADGELPANYFDPNAPVVVDEWGLLNEPQIAALEQQAEAIRADYGVNVYFHTTGDRMGMKREAYNSLYMASMGYEKDAVLFAVENDGGDTVKYSHVYFYGSVKERVPEKFRSRIANNASAAGNGYGRLYEGQRLLAAYLENGRVPRNGFYWTMIVVLSSVVGGLAGLVSVSNADDDMQTVSSRKTAYSYLDRSQTRVEKLSEVLLYVTTRRHHVPSSDSSTRSSHSSGGRSTYKSSYSGHSGVSHTGHGRKF